MKNIRESLLLIFVLLIGMTINVKAEDFNYYLTNSNNYEPINNNESKNIKRGDTITVTAMINNANNVTDYKISSGKLTIRWDDKYFSLQEVNGKYYNDSISDISGLTISSVNKGSNKLTINEISSTGTLKDKLNKLVEFKFKVLEDASSTTTKIYQMDGEDSLKCLKSDETIVSCGESSLSELKYTISKSDENKLTTIKINDSAIEGFKEDTKNYNIKVDSSITKIKIDVVKKDVKSTIIGDGEKQVQYGNNKYEIVVTSESGVKNTYTINVERLDNRSSVNTLKTLTISSGELSFSPNITTYTVNVLNDVDKVTITSSLSDSKAKYVVDYQNKEVELVEGSNKIEIKVVSEKGEEKVYTLNINRALSSNNSLKSLKVNDEKITILENEFNYDITVENEVNEAIIVAIPNSDKATVKLDESYPLVVGDNEITIKVVAADGEEAIYTLNIIRKKVLSKDSLLVSLKIEGYDINFKPEVTLYNLKINEDTNELAITTVAKDPDATVDIEGNKNLENGSIIKVNVRAEDGSFTRYFINIEKGSKGISPIIIVIIILLLMLGTLVGIIIYRKKKQEKEELAKLDETNTKIIDNPIETNREEDNEINTEVEPDETSEENYVGAHAENYVGVHEESHEEESSEKEKDE